MTTTPAMKAFIKKNAQHKIVEGARLTPEEKHVKTRDDMARSNLIKYWFEDGESFTLSRSDLRSAPDYKPLWVD